MDQVTIIGIDISTEEFPTPWGVRQKASRSSAKCFRGEVPCISLRSASAASPSGPAGKAWPGNVDEPSSRIYHRPMRRHAHHWGRQIIALGHACKLIPPIYVKPFLKRQKNDSNDAAAIVEAAQRPTMRFVAVKSEEAQADAMLFRTRALLVRQRTQTINSLRGQLAEFGVIAAQGVGSIAMLRFEWGAAKATLPEQVVPMTELLFEQIAALSQKIAGLEKEIRSRTRAREEMKRLMTIPGIGPICAMAVSAFAPPMESFGCGRDFAAWVGLTPRQHSTAGKQRLGRITKMGQRDLRQLLVLGATSVLRHMRKREELDDPWLRRMIAEKPPKLVAVALANKMARIIWALSVKKECYRAPVATAAAGE